MSKEAPSRRTGHGAIGALVMSLDHRHLGIGKVVDAQVGSVTIEYFDSVANPVAERIVVFSERVVRAGLDRQLRVYFRDGARWGVGRVIDEEFGRVLVRPPGNAQDRWRGIEDLFVRWDRPVGDPVAVLRDRALETPYYYFARRAFVDAMFAQDTAVRGNRSLTSASIEIYDHQVRVASRVLADPVRRFLLADEVGMGKTIEAGLVVRQLLLDQPEAYVRVIAPTRMCHQWMRELRERFFIDDSLLSTVEVLDAADSASWRVSAEQGPPDLLVVDEAHHVARWAHGSSVHQRRFVEAARLAHSAAGLLLLSATPVAHNETTYLSMLHLLDPDNYSLDQAAEFRRRVENRHDLARAFVLFRPGQTFRRLERNADRLRDLLGSDEISVARLDELLQLGAGSEQADLDSAIRALRVAISDRHRLHYRMLRSRRDEASDFPIRGRRLDRVVDTAPAGDVRLAEWLDRWRAAFATDCGDKLDGEQQDTARCMLDRALAFPTVLRAAVDYRLGDRGPESLAGAGAADRDALGAPVGAEERAALEAFDPQEFAELEEARTQNLLDLVWSIPRRRKVVVFAGHTLTAAALGQALTGLLDRDQVVTHTADLSLSDSEQALRRFREERACNVLVCDESAEEGLNLQFAEILIHAELPGDPNRLEQRIGRLDRHGEQSPVDNIVLADGYEGSLLDASIALLRDGFGVFDRSISSFQFVVDALAPEITTTIMQEGPVGLARIAHSLPERLESEKREISQQDQLDSIEAIEISHPVAEALRELDTDWEELEADHEALICAGKGHLRFTREPYFRDDALCSYWSTDPRRGTEPLVPQRDLTSFVLGATSESGAVRNGSHDRQAALRHPGARVWRAGDPFLDGLLRYVRERDVRGRAYAVWRSPPDMAAGEWLAALRFDVLLQAGSTPSGGDEAGDRIVGRRANSLLPPMIETVWVGVDNLEVRDPRLRARLSAKYSPSFGDVRLGLDRWTLAEEVLAGLDWQAWCTEARETALSVATQRGSVVSRLEVASAEATRFGEARIEALRSRQSLRPDAASALHFEEESGTRVTAAVRRPRVEVDAAGLVILAGKRIEAAGE